MATDSNGALLFLKRFRKNRLANIQQLSLSVGVDGTCVFLTMKKLNIYAGLPKIALSIINGGRNSYAKNKG